MTKLKMAGTALLLLGFAAIGAGVWASQKARPGDESPPAQRPAEKSPSVVARVDGTSITRDESIQRCLARYGAKELDALINLAIFRSGSERHGIKITNAEVEAEAARIAGEYGISPEAWYRILKDQRGWSKDDYLREIVYPKLMLSKLEDLAPGTIFDEIKQEAHIEIYFDRTRDGGDKTAEKRVRSQAERLMEVERRIDEIFNAPMGPKRDESR